MTRLAPPGYPAMLADGQDRFAERALQSSLSGLFVVMAALLVLWVINTSPLIDWSWNGWTGISAIATLALAVATVPLAVVVVIDGRRQRTHDARQHVLQRRHDHLQGAYAALIRSVVLAMELQRRVWEVVGCW